MNSATQPAKPALLLLGSRMEPGGRQQSLLDQTRWFFQNGHRVVLAFLCDAAGVYARWQSRVPVPIMNLKAYNPGGLPLSNALRGLGGMVRISQMAAIGEFDALLACGPEAALSGLPVAWLSNVPHRIAVYTGPPERPGLYAWTVNRMAKCLVVDSPRAGEEAAALGIRPEKIHCIPPGITPAEETNPHPFRTRWDLGFSEECLLVVAAGEMSARSAYPGLLRAIEQVSARVPGTGFALLGDGPLRPGLVEEARKLGIADRVRFVSDTGKVNSLLATADLYLALPGADEGAFELLRVLSMGKPVIAVDAGAAGEVIEDGANGLLVPPGDEAALAETLASLLDDGYRREKLARAGKERVLRDYTLERMCAAYAALLDPAFQLEVE